MSANIKKGRIAFEQKEGAFVFRAFYLDVPKGEALVEIEREGEPFGAFYWPAYKIWNISAHAPEIAGSLARGDDLGLRIAGDTGFGGNVWPRPHPTKGDDR